MSESAGNTGGTFEDRLVGMPEAAGEDQRRGSRWLRTVGWIRLVLLVVWVVSLLGLALSGFGPMLGWWPAGGRGLFVHVMLGGAMAAGLLLVLGMWGARATRAGFAIDILFWLAVLGAWLSILTALGFFMPLFGQEAFATVLLIHMWAGGASVVCAVAAAALIFIRRR